MKPIKYIAIISSLFFFSCSNDTENKGVSSNTDNQSSEQTPLKEIEDGEKDQILINFNLSPSDYISWMKNKEVNPLIKSKKIGEFNYTLTHLPVEYMICNELKKTSITKIEMDSLSSEYSGMEYYELRIRIDGFNDETAKYNVADMSQYQQRIAYMAFDMQNDFTAKIDGSKTIDCKLYHFERTYGVAPYATFLMGFSKEDIGNSTLERTIIFNDKLFNKGLIKFNWSIDQLTNIPKIQVS